MSSSDVTWISLGRAGCKGNTITLPEANGTVLRTTCDSCSLEWTTPAEKAVSS